MEHYGLWREQLGGLCHEAHAAEDDYGRMAFRRLAGEFKRIPHEVRDVLYFGACVVVRKDQRVPPDLPFEYFFDYFHVSLSSVAMMA